MSIPLSFLSEVLAHAIRYYETPLEDKIKKTIKTKGARKRAFNNLTLL